jgi:RNA polymerase sigma-70 factor (ECF subfamily)
MERKRTNQEWLDDLQGPDHEEAIADLLAILKRGLTYALSSRGNVDEGHIEDFAQDAVLRILDKLDTFRGESQFTTWANKIAIHVAFTELRRRRWQNISLDGIVESQEGDWIPESLADPGATPEQQATQRQLLSTLRRLITRELTDKQRQAMVAIVLQGMPLDEVARKMDTNRNALYKLLHDARKALKRELLAEGLSPDDVLDAFET